MTSKEALEYLTSKVFTGGNSILETEAEICANVIKQDLERLEVLEKEKEYLKTTNEALNEMLLQASNEAIKFETENEQLKDSIQIKQKQVNECIDTLTQENEKLKKAIEILNDAVILPMENDIAKVDTKGNNYYRLIFARRLLTEQEYELLKEVLGE